MSKLQVYAQRCPVMGKALAVQSAKYSAAGSFRAFSGHAKSGKAKIHTSRKHDAQAVDHPLFERGEKGKSNTNFPRPLR